MKSSVKKGDNVLVIAGKDAKKTGEILSVNEGRVTVANVNIQSHHRKPRSKDDKGGILKSEGAIDISNVQVVCPNCKRATRVAHSIVDGKKVRVCKKCGASLDAPAAKKAVKSTTTKTAAKSTAKSETAKASTKSTTKTASKSESNKSKSTKTSTTKTSTAKTSTAKTSTAKSSKKA